MPNAGAYSAPTSTSITSGSTSSGNAVWYSWNAGSTSSATQTYSATTDGIVWEAWNGTSFTIPTSRGIVATYDAQVATRVWSQWNQSPYAQMGTQPSPYVRIVQPAQHRHPVSAEERVALAARLEEQRQRQRIEATRIEAAKDRAEKLLHEMLSPKQVEELKANNHFHLETVSANGERRRYRINRGRHGNVDQVDASGNRIKRLCVHPVEGVPDADTMLAQKLFLEGSEEELLRVANHS